MPADDTQLLLRLGDLYTREGGDVDLATFLLENEVDGDDLIADVIESDGRHRVSSGRDVDLRRYFRAIPDLVERPDCLDAAIDVTLRRLTRDGTPRSEAIDRLVRENPQLATPIREAAALDEAIWSTRRLRRSVVQPIPRTLPADLGPPTPDGVPRYRLERMLGRGAFGQVFLAVDRQLSEDEHEAMVAVKVLARRRDAAWHRARMSDEATKARRIDHPNVVRVLDRGVSDDDEDFVVYEYVDAGDLDAWMEREIGVREAVHLVADIARGVQAAHSAGLVHCDLKPGNVMMTEHGTPKIADFGVAVLVGEALEGIRDGEGPDRPIGNVAYISPEQFRCEPGSLTAASDVYALGGILYRLLTGTLPNGASVDEIARNHQRGQGRTAPPEIVPRRAGVDRDLAMVCRRAMALEPADRHNSAGELADDLEAWLRREPIRWTHPSVVRRLRLWTRRQPALAILSLLLLTSIVVGEAAWRESSRKAAEAEADAVRAEANRAIAEAQAEFAKERQQIARQTTIGFRELYLPMLRGDERLSTAMLAMLWAFQNLLDTGLLDMSGGGDVWRDRVAYVSRHLATADAQGRGEQVEAMIWRPQLAFWLVQSGDWSAAEGHLERSRAFWSGILDPRDEWLADIESLQRLIRLRRALDGSDDDALERAAADVLEELAPLAARHPDSPILHFSKALLRETYGPARLDDEGRLAALEEAMTGASD